MSKLPVPFIPLIPALFLFLPRLTSLSAFYFISLGILFLSLLLCSYFQPISNQRPDFDFFPLLNLTLSLHVYICVCIIQFLLDPFWRGSIIFFWICSVLDELTRSRIILAIRGRAREWRPDFGHLRVLHTPVVSSAEQAGTLMASWVRNQHNHLVSFRNSSYM